MEKNNKNLNVPNLRFPEFSGEWDNVSLGDISDITKLAGFEFTQYVQYEDSGNIIALRGLNCKNGSLDLTDVKYIDNSILEKLTRSKLYIGDILFTYVGTVGEVAIIEENDRFYLAPNVSRIRVEQGYNPYFIKQLIHTKRFYNKIIFPLIATSSQPALSMENVRKFSLSIPQESEQGKLAEFLNILDQRISTQKKIIEKYESLIRGLITCVNNGKIGQCKTVCLRELLTECHEKNSDNHEVCSVSVSHGVINQVDYLGRSFAAKEVLHYNIVNYGDIVYTKSPTGEFPYGIVKRSNLDRPVAVSPLYGVYRPVNDYVGIYLHLYFKSPVNTKNYLHRLIQKGAKNTINITNQHFLDNKILIPEHGWLEIIVNAASTIEKMIQIECDALLWLERQKNYLISKMFI